MRGTYTKFIQQQKAEIGRQATDHAATVCCYQKTTTISWYQEKPHSHQDKTSEIGWREGNKDFTNILEKGRPSLSFRGGARKEGLSIFDWPQSEQCCCQHSHIVVGCAEGIVKSKDSHFLVSTGEHIVSSKH